ncbi:glycosyltransferase family 1 protein [Metabacillus sp. GX 13764]|uniref:glycosyltransferase family 1 protein n=1 Tax=Metabacillus kandeliae TaxID=2900151 RepID=UPI001E477A57|nr:glycosyltransferase family 1 protein [Metabacillus kandeliae]MCD7033139.1 glycosyltransferase family 1 protein [Metabacillus kandeliae]
MEPVRILQVVTIMNRGGLETMLMNYYRKIDRSQIQFDFMVHRDEKGHYDDEINSLGGRIYRMPSIKPGSYKRYFKLLDDFFKEHKDYKVIHAHNNENSSFVLRAAKKAGVPYRIAHSHLSDLGLDYKYPFRLYARYFLKDSTNFYFACSNSAGKWLFNKEKFTVLNNAVDASRFRFKQENRVRIKKELGIEEGLVIGHVGRFNKQKNHKYLLEIFKEVNKRRKDSHLILVGEGHLQEEMKRKAVALGVAPNVHFLGVQKNIEEIMHAMDLFLFPSLFEGLPVVLIEAQAAGLKCVVSDTITKEADLTQRLVFKNIRENPSEWADHILSLDYDHADTFKMIQKSGYDAAANARWLENFYSEKNQIGVN